MTNILRWLIQVTLVVLVAFFGYHYFTRPELRSCVSVPLASLDGRTPLSLDQDKVDAFMAGLADGWQGVASRSGELYGQLGSVPRDTDASAQEQLLDTGQYLYCKAVIDKVERES